MEALGAGYLADKYCRMTTLIICAFLFAESGTGAAVSHQFFSFVFYRIVGGMGVGAATMLSPMYIAEVPSAYHWGRLVAFYRLAIVTRSPWPGYRNGSRL